LSKIKKDTGFENRVDLETGLRRTIDWYKKNWVS